mgnify:CR=1 FL=1
MLKSLEYSEYLYNDMLKICTASIISLIITMTQTLPILANVFQASMYVHPCDILHYLFFPKKLFFISRISITWQNDLSENIIKVVAMIGQ